MIVKGFLLSKLFFYRGFVSLDVGINVVSCLVLFDGSFRLCLDMSETEWYMME